MKYMYDVDSECFRRIDGLGRPLMINIEEARNIDKLLDLGYSVVKVYEKLDLSVTIYTLRTFVSNLREGNIDLNGDYELPVKVVEQNNLQDRVTKLEKEVEKLNKWKNTPCEDCISEITDNHNGAWGKVKSWIKM